MIDRLILSLELEFEFELQTELYSIQEDSVDIFLIYSLKPLYSSNNLSLCPKNIRA